MYQIVQCTCCCCGCCWLCSITFLHTLDNVRGKKRMAKHLPNVHCSHVYCYGSLFAFFFNLLVLVMLLCWHFSPMSHNLTAFSTSLCTHSDVNSSQNRQNKLWYLSKQRGRAQTIFNEFEMPTIWVRFDTFVVGQSSLTSSTHISIPILTNINRQRFVYSIEMIVWISSIGSERERTWTVAAALAHSISCCIIFKWETKTSHVCVYIVYLAKIASILISNNNQQVVSSSRRHSRNKATKWGTICTPTHEVRRGERKRFWKLNDNKTSRAKD